MKSGKFDLFEQFMALAYSFVGLIMSGARDVTWGIEKLQAAISESKDDLPESICDFWERCHPRRGRAIAKLLAPFYANQFSLNLMPASPCLPINVDEVGRLFGFKIKGIIPIVYDRENPEAFRILGSRKFRFYFYHLLNNIAIDVKKAYGEQYPWYEIEREFQEAQAHRSLLHQPVLYENAWYFNGSGVWGELSKSLINGLEDSLKMAVICKILGTKHDFTGLLALWRSGNLPVGFTTDNELVVLVAKK